VRFSRPRPRSSRIRDGVPGEPSGPALEIHNYRITRGDAIAMGVVNASVPFVPVFIARLGGSPLEVSLLIAIPAVSGFLLAIPVGQFLQSRRRIVSWYSRSRMIAHLAYASAAIAVLVAPREAVVPVILVIWAFAAIPSTIGIVSFPVVMDGAAGPRGRYDLMSRRWSIMGLTTAVSVGAIGVILTALPFPANYQVVFVGFSVAGLVSYHFSRQFRLPEADQREAEARQPVIDRVRAMVGTVRSEPAFLRFCLRRQVYVFGSLLVLPLIPLYYVRVVLAPDIWIGVIATVQSLSLLAGYLIWRRQSVERGARFVLLIALLFAALHPAALSLVDGVVVVAVLAGLGAVFMAGVDLSMFDELMRTIPRRYGVTFTSVDTALVNGASIVAPLAGAALAVGVGFPNALRVGSLIALIGFALFALDAIRGGRALRPGLTSAGRSRSRSTATTAGPG
jgi:hypothetical protein